MISYEDGGTHRICSARCIADPGETTSVEVVDVPVYCPCWIVIIIQCTIQGREFKLLVRSSEITPLSSNLSIHWNHDNDHCMSF